jgi:hypothetical protein
MWGAEPVTNSMTNKTLRACRLAATLAVVSIASGASAKNTPALTDTGTFRAAFSAAFYGFDICGDAADGAIYRKALIEKVDHCPFTPDAKASFRQWSADTGKRATADIQRYIAEHDKLPERLDPKKLNCRKERETPAYQETITLLARYAKGEVGFDAVVPDACDAKAGTPQR